VPPSARARNPLRRIGEAVARAFRRFKAPSWGAQRAGYLDVHNFRNRE
jgi:hypothetical protein